MLVLVAAVVVVGALCATDLLLTFGVIRRLREHTELITRLSVPDVPVIGVPVGGSPDGFAAPAVDGQDVSGPAGLTIAAFFSTTCSACPEKVPPFLAYLREHDIARDAALAVVRGPQEEPPPFLADLTPAARVCTEDGEDTLAQAFKVVGYPAFCLLRADGAILAASHDPAMLPRAEAAAGAR